MDVGVIGRSFGVTELCAKHKPGKGTYDVKKNELKPWQVKSWVIPAASAEFVCQMEEILDVYERPYDPQFPVVCLDESPKQLISEAQKGFVDSKGVQHFDYEYKREGVTDIFMVVEPLGATRKVFIMDSHDSHQWAAVVAYIVENMYPQAIKISLVQDNLSAHRKAALYEVFDPQRARSILKKLEFVWTPKHGSWLNIAECELSILTKQGLQSRIASKDELEKQASLWADTRNNKLKKVDWQFTTNDARIKLKRLYPSNLT